MHILFLGAFNRLASGMSKDSSVAGSKVQMEIIRVLSSLYGEDAVKCAVFPELASWPKNRLFIKKTIFDNVFSLFTINLPVVKRFFFSVQVLYFVVRFRPKYIVQYNTTLLMNIFMIFYNFFCKKRILILQDLNSAVTFKAGMFLRPVSLLNYLGTKSIRHSFDFFIPISNSLIQDLNLPVDNCFLWQGGGASLQESEESFLVKKNIAVFAGALEEYNGVDILVSMWDKLSVDIELHIFGKGKLAGDVLEFSQRNKNIKYHGFQNPEVVKSFVSSALFNFCLRYSRGIDQNYFFPSKFFDLLAEPGNLVCNNFNNIPEELMGYIVFLDDDLSNLNDVLLCGFPSEIEVFKRRAFLLENYTWGSFLKKTFQEFEDN